MAGGRKRDHGGAARNCRWDCQQTTAWFCWTYIREGPLVARQAALWELEQGREVAAATNRIECVKADVCPVPEAVCWTFLSQLYQRLPARIEGLP